MRISAVGTGQRVIVICVKYSNVTTTRLANCTDWVDLLNREVNTFYNQATFNQTNFTFEAPTTGGPADGWFSLGYNSMSYDYNRTGQDAINLADPYVDFSQYNRVLVITNWPGFGGQGLGFLWWRTAEGGEVTFMEDGMSVRKRQMSLAIINEWEAHSYGGPIFGGTYDEAASVAAHEIGHQLDLPTHYFDLRWNPGMLRDVLSPWDIMGRSPTLNHFIGWAKVHRGWIPAGPRIETVGPPVGRDIDRNIILRPLETTTSGVQVIKIPFTSAGPFSGYIVENRQRINGDEQLPSAGVLVSLVNENPGILPNCIVLDNPRAAGNINTAPLVTGDSLNDPARNLRITAVSQTGDDFNLRIQYSLPLSARPDPMIEHWGAPPYETPDIWIDSERNGWDTYRYTDGAGNPIGNGDDAWVNHDNRVYVRIRNLGPGVATNVRVQVYVNQPPGMGDAGADWQYLGTIFFPTIPAGGMPVQDFVIWRPTVGAHTCIKAIIEDVPGEIDSTNNRAQENVVAFDSTRGSPWQPVGLKIRVNNPHMNKETPVIFNVHDIPPGWAILVDPPTMIVPPGSYQWVNFMAYPSGAPGEDNPDEKKYQPGFIGKPKIEALVPYADTFISIGGVDLWAHLVESTKLTVEATIAKQQATVSGKVIPAIANATIAVELISGDKRELRHTKTDERGDYSLSLDASISGISTVQAFYSGDMTYAAAESDLLQIDTTKD